MSHNIKGITIIELMIVVGIVAVLVVTAIPAYKNYTIRAKVTECVNDAAVGKLSISEFKQTLGDWPANINQAGLQSVGITRYCAGFSDYQANSGAFTINVNEAAIDDNLNTLSPVLSPIETLNHSIVWTCSRGATAEDDLRYLPPSCRGS